MQTEKTRALAADKAGMDEKTARKYVKLGKMPSEVLPLRTWRTREDPFREVWEEIKQMLSESSGFEAKTLFEYLQRRSPGTFSDGQVRTLQRRVKRWRALEEPAREVFFPQVYQPGEEFTARYRALLRHYGLEGRKTNPNSPHENGDTEQRHHRLKRTVEQALLLRGSRDFRIRAEYETFLRMLFRRMNSSRMLRWERRRSPGR